MYSASGIPSSPICMAIACFIPRRAVVVGDFAAASELVGNTLDTAPVIGSFRINVSGCIKRFFALRTVYD